jgi:hypothetical protein
VSPGRACTLAGLNRAENCAPNSGVFGRSRAERTPTVASVETFAPVRARAPIDEGTEPDPRPVSASILATTPTPVAAPDNKKALSPGLS